LQQFFEVELLDEADGDGHGGTSHGETTPACPPGCGRVPLEDAGEETHDDCHDGFHGDKMWASEGHRRTTVNCSHK
jgi:hypothetical protein